MGQRVSALVLATLHVAFSGCINPDHRAFDALVLNRPAPDFELEALDGGKARLSGFRGKPVVLAFFAYG